MIDDQPEDLIDPFAPPRDEPSTLREFSVLVALAVLLPVGAMALVSKWPALALALALLLATLNAARIAKRFDDPSWRGLAERVASQPGMWQRQARRLLQTG